MATTLTRDEATARAAVLTVSSYDVTLDLTDSTETFTAGTTILFEATEHSETFLELAGQSVAAIQLNGTPLDVAAVWDKAASRVTLTGLAARNTLEIDSRMHFSTTGEGLHRFVDPSDGEAYLYTQFETYDAHRMFPCFDQPDLKAVFTFHVTAPAHWTVVSNYAVAGRTSAGQTQTVDFQTTAVMSTYITALVAGPYAEVRTLHDGIDLGLFCRRSLERYLDADELFEITKQGFDFYHRVFDYRYPFGKYDQLFVPEFNAGAMENAGCVTYRDEYIFHAKVTDARRERRAETVLHEMAHMWFGDLVTMKWWDDLWLNESFATYMSVLCMASATRWTDAWTTFANVEKTDARSQDQLPSTHPIVADASDMQAVLANFDGITYAKGASVLKQLVAWVGQEEFLAGLRGYFRKHEFANTTLADLLTELEASSGRDLSGWSAQWLETTGVNTMRPVLSIDGDGMFTSVAIAQSAVADHPTIRSHRVAVGLYDLLDGALTRRDRIELDVAGELTEVPSLVGIRQPDLLLLNDDDLTYTKVRLDERSLTTLMSSIASITDSLPRALCWTAAWDMLRDAEIGSGDYLALVLSGLRAEADGDIGVLQTLLNHASAAILLYGNPAARPARQGALAAECLTLLDEVKPGSDQQLVFALHAVRNCTAEGSAGGGEAVARLRGWLDGVGVPAGLVIDSEVRWTILTRLSLLGAATTGEIDAEEARDKTDTATNRAKTARAAAPVAAAKAQAWDAVVEGGSLSNYESAATVQGFVTHEQGELLAPYVERYFAALPGIMSRKSPDSARRLAISLYPSWAASSAVLEATDAFVASGAAVSGLPRVLAEGRDTVERILRVRAADTALLPVA